MSKAPTPDWPDVSPAGLRKMAEIERLSARAEPSTPPAGEREIHPSELLIETWPPTPKVGMIVGMSKGVKITHRPTGSTVTCDTERSQHLNRDRAWEMLRAALAAQPEPAAQDIEDAERYRYLRDDQATEFGEPWAITRYAPGDERNSDSGTCPLFGKELDAAIDAARAATKTQGGA